MKPTSRSGIVPVIALVWTICRFTPAAPAAGVQWLDWSPAAFQSAKEQDRLVLLNLTANWGRWCVAMEQETYTDPAVAEIISASFVPVRVDRDEYPEITDRYKAEGWPTTAILTARGETVDTTSYLPPARLVAFLRYVDRAYRQDRATLDKANAAATERAAALAERALVREPTGELSPRILKDIAASIAICHDDIYGGFARDLKGKYHYPEVLEFLLLQASADASVEAASIARITLSQMARSGIRDHIDGGFFRSAGDARWLDPRFDKTLADNAGLLRVYVRAWRMFDDALYRQTAEETIAFLDRALWDPAQGLYRLVQRSNAVGAEPDTYHSWAAADLGALLPQPEREVFALRYGITDQGEIRGGDGISRTGRNVLYLAESIEETARVLGTDKATIEARLGNALEKLRAAHAKAPAPPVDPRCSVPANALLVQAYLDAAVAFERPALRQRALAVLQTLLEKAWDPEQGALYMVRDGKAINDRLSLDDAVLVSALISAYSHTGDPEHLERAKAVLAVLDKRFSTPNGGYRDFLPQGVAQGLLAIPLADPETAAEAAGALLDLALITQEPAYRQRALRALRGHALRYTERGHLEAGYACAVRKALDPPARVIVTGSQDDKRSAELLEAANRVSLQYPNTLVLRLDPGRNPSQARAQGLGNVAKAGVVVCTAQCGSVVDSYDTLARAVAAVAQPGRRTDKR